MKILDKKKDELKKKNLEVKNKFKETAKLINNKSFLFHKEIKKMVICMVQLNQKKLQT